MTQTFTHSDLLQRVMAAFPDVAEDLASVADYPTLEASVFGHRLQRAKGAADWDAYKRGVRLIEELWARADEQLDGELRWSVMKGLDFDGPRGAVAWECLGPELRHAWAVTRRKLDALSALPAPTRRSRRGHQ
jgi:hypothetical protein